MPTMLAVQCDAILDIAASADIGIVVHTNDAYRARQTLYRFRQELGKPEYKNIQIRVSPTDSEHEIWLIRMTAVTVDLLRAKPDPEAQTHTPSGVDIL